MSSTPPSFLLSFSPPTLPNSGTLSWTGLEPSYGLKAQETIKQEMAVSLGNGSSRNPGWALQNPGGHFPEPDLSGATTLTCGYSARGALAQAGEPDFPGLNLSPAS